MIEDKFSMSCPSGRLSCDVHHWTSVSRSIASPSEYRLSSVREYKVLSRSISFKSYTKFETHEYMSWYYSLVSRDTELISNNSSVFRLESTTISEVPVCTNQDGNNLISPSEHLESVVNDPADSSWTLRQPHHLSGRLQWYLRCGWCPPLGPPHGQEYRHSNRDLLPMMLNFQDLAWSRISCLRWNGDHWDLKVMEGSVALVG